MSIREAALDDVEACGCIAEQSVSGDSQPITVSTTLASVDGLAEFLCNGNFTVKIDVSVSYCGLIIRTSTANCSGSAKSSY